MCCRIDEAISKNAKISKEQRRKMDAHKALITNIFNNSTLVEVPFFQRSYVWKEDLWGRLLEDMEFVVKTKKPHFLGSIILKEGRKPKLGENFAEFLLLCFFLSS